MAKDPYRWRTTLGGSAQKGSEDAECPQEIEKFEFLLPSSLNGPPSPSSSNTPLPRQSVIGTRSFFVMQDNENMPPFQFSGASEPFTPVHTRPSSPASSEARESVRIQRELADSVYKLTALTENLRLCQKLLKEKSGENVKLRRHINTLYDVIGEPTHPPDDYFIGEFGMLWRSIHNFGKCFYKFSTEANVPAELGDVMKNMLGEEEMVYRIVRDSRTKLMVIVGILARYLTTEVFHEEYFKSIGGNKIVRNDDSGIRALRGYCNGIREVVDKVDLAIDKFATIIARDIHKFLLPLMSRPSDQKHIDESLRQLITFIEHASRLWVKILSLGSNSWRFVFPSSGIKFRDRLMVPCDACNLGLSGEQNKKNHVIELEEKKIVFCVLPAVENFVTDGEGNGEWAILIKASVFLE